MLPNSACFNGNVLICSLRLSSVEDLLKLHNSIVSIDDTFPNDNDCHLSGLAVYESQRMDIALQFVMRIIRNKADYLEIGVED